LYFKVKLKTAILQIYFIEKEKRRIFMDVNSFRGSFFVFLFIRKFSIKYSHRQNVNTIKLTAMVKKEQPN